MESEHIRKNNDSILKYIFIVIAVAFAFTFFGLFISDLIYKFNPQRLYLDLYNIDIIKPEKIEELYREEAINIANGHKYEFQEIAERTIKENGYDYSVKININNFYFPTKNYGDISLPAGYYDALRVEIGEAKGQNWWCVMFPSLCFIDVTSGVVDDEAKENLEENMEEESYSIISENADNLGIKFKFKLIEFFSESGLFTAKN